MMYATDAVADERQEAKQKLMSNPSAWAAGGSGDLLKTPGVVVAIGIPPVIILY